MKKITFLLTFAALALQPLCADAMWNKFTTRFAPAYASVFGARTGVQKSAVKAFTTGAKEAKSQTKAKFYSQWLQRTKTFIKDEPYTALAITLYGAFFGLLAKDNMHKLSPDDRTRYLKHEQEYEAAQYRDALRREGEALCRAAKNGDHHTFRKIMNKP